MNSHTIRTIYPAKKNTDSENIDIAFAALNILFAVIYIIALIVRIIRRRRKKAISNRRPNIQLHSINRDNITGFGIQQPQNTDHQKEKEIRDIVWPPLKGEEQDKILVENITPREFASLPKDEKTGVSYLSMILNEKISDTEIYESFSELPVVDMPVLSRIWVKNQTELGEMDYTDWKKEFENAHADIDFKILFRNLMKISGAKVSEGELRGNRFITRQWEYMWDNFIQKYIGWSRDVRRVSAHTDLANFFENSLEGNLTNYFEKKICPESAKIPEGAENFEKLSLEEMYTFGKVDETKLPYLLQAAFVNISRNPIGQNFRLRSAGSLRKDLLDFAYKEKQNNMDFAVWLIKFEEKYQNNYVGLDGVTTEWGGFIKDIFKKLNFEIGPENEIIASTDGFRCFEYFISTIVRVMVESDNKTADFSGNGRLGATDIIKMIIPSLYDKQHSSKTTMLFNLMRQKKIPGTLLTYATEVLGKGFSAPTMAYVNKLLSKRDPTLKLIWPAHFACLKHEDLIKFGVDSENKIPFVALFIMDKCRGKKPTVGDFYTDDKSKKQHAWEKEECFLQFAKDYAKENESNKDLVKYAQFKENCDKKLRDDPEKLENENIWLLVLQKYMSSHRFGIDEGGSLTGSENELKELDYFLNNIVKSDESDGLTNPYDPELVKYMSGVIFNTMFTTKEEYKKKIDNNEECLKSYIEKLWGLSTSQIYYY